jgi:hypothetical protein
MCIGGRKFREILLPFFDFRRAIFIGNKFIVTKTLAGLLFFLLVDIEFQEPSPLVVFHFVFICIFCMHTYQCSLFNLTMSSIEPYSHGCARVENKLNGK